MRRTAGGKQISMFCRNGFSLRPERNLNDKSPAQRKRENTSKRFCLSGDKNFNQVPNMTQISVLAHILICMCSPSFLSDLLINLKENLSKLVLHSKIVKQLGLWMGLGMIDGDGNEVVMGMQIGEMVEMVEMYKCLRMIPSTHEAKKLTRWTVTITTWGSPT